MRVRDLLLRLRATTNRTAEQLPALLKKVAALAAGAAAALAALTVSAAAVVDEMAKSARNLAVTVAGLQSLRLAADLAGVSTEHLTVGLATMQRQLGAAAKGSKEAVAALKAVGLTADDISRPVDEVFGDLLDGLARIPAGAQRNAVAMVLLGESGARMGTLIEGGSAAIRGATEALAGMDALISEKAAKSAEDFTDRLTLLRARVGALSTAIGLRLIPVGTRVVGWLDALAATVAPAALKAVEAAARVTGAALDLLATPLGMIVGLLAGGAGIVALAKWAASFSAVQAVLAFLTPTVLAVVAGIAALGLAIDDLIVFAQGGQSAIGRLITTLLGAEAAEDARQVLLGIGEVITSAAEAAMSALPSWETLLGVLTSIGEAAASAYDSLLALAGVEDASGRLVRGAQRAARGAGNLSRQALSGARSRLEAADRGFDRVTAANTNNVQITVQGATGPEVARAIKREIGGLAAEATAGVR